MKKDVEILKHEILHSRGYTISIVLEIEIFHIIIITFFYCFFSGRKQPTTSLTAGSSSSSKKAGVR